MNLVRSDGVDAFEGLEILLVVGDSKIGRRLSLEWLEGFARALRVPRFPMLCEKFTYQSSQVLMKFFSSASVELQTTVYTESLSVMSIRETDHFCSKNF